MTRPLACVVTFRCRGVQMAETAAHLVLVRLVETADSQGVRRYFPVSSARLCAFPQPPDGSTVGGRALQLSVQLGSGAGIA
jgi:hypothetical protein